MARNVEVKARLEDPARARAVARRLGGVWQWTARQTDTYFHTADGSRMKLRETVGQSAELITYRRPDERGPRTSAYETVAVPNPAESRVRLATRRGVDVVVSKVRELWLLGDTRIHIDEVEDLGPFLELEVVLDVGTGEEAGHQRAATLARSFGLGAPDYVAGSYADLLRVALADQD